MSRVAVNGHVLNDWRLCIDGSSLEVIASVARAVRGLVHLDRDIDLNSDNDRKDSTLR